MHLPRIACGVDRAPNVDCEAELEPAGIEPQVRCQADYTARRTRCRGRGWRRICIPQVKEGRYIAHGSDCGSCFAQGRADATRAGGWRIMSEWGRRCD